MSAWLFTAIIFVPLYIGVNRLFARFWPDPDKWPWQKDEKP